MGILRSISRKGSSSMRLMREKKERDRDDDKRKMGRRVLPNGFTQRVVLNWQHWHLLRAC